MVDGIMYTSKAWELIDWKVPCSSATRVKVIRPGDRHHLGREQTSPSSKPEDRGLKCSAADTDVAALYVLI